jgi:hypothetical protein
VHFINLQQKEGSTWLYDYVELGYTGIFFSNLKRNI